MIEERVGSDKDIRSEAKMPNYFSEKLGEKPISPPIFDAPFGSDTNSITALEGTISLNQNGTQLSDDVNADKLLVEIVQGLLMAHARLDSMEVTLRQAVEKASREHLNSFDKNLREVDIRFQKTTVDAGQAVSSLKDARTDLVRSVERAAEQNLNNFNTRADNIHRVVENSQTVSTSNFAAHKEHQNYLANSLKQLLNAQVETASRENAKQSENWKNLLQYLTKWQAKNDTAFAHAAGDVQISTSTVVDKLEDSSMQIQNVMIKRAETNRRLLICLVCLSAVSILFLGAIVYKLFIR